MTTATTIITGISWEKTEAITFPGYEALAARFQEEVEELWRAEDEAKH